MAGLEKAKQYFPLQNIKDVIDLFKYQLSETGNINLGLLSIVLGTVENALTVNRSLSSGRETNGNLSLQPIFPIIEWETIEVLYTKFETIVKSSVDLSKYPDKYATRELVKRVSDVVWGGLSRAFYKDKAHLQSLHSFLTGNKLDCFGVAFAVVAAFQVLGYTDVHLALSEDHAWVVFGEDQKLTAEVTWHGKGNEDKRGQPITDTVSAKHWLYLNGYPVVCTIEMEVAAIVSGINPSITATVDSVELGSLQQELLWLLYDLGHLDKYPMALGNLADLEEICESPGRPPPTQLFEMAVESARIHYSNQHIYPYTYLGGHRYRAGNYRECLESWAQASAVIKHYNYNREDEEIYKEFIEIANDSIPNMMRSVAGDNASRLRRTSLLHNSEAYADFLRFYDGICEWEEDSRTPVLHTVWAKQFVYSLGKFDPRVRKCIQIHAEGEPDESTSEEESSEEENDENRDVNTTTETVKEEMSVKKRRGRKQKGKVIKQELHSVKVENGENVGDKSKLDKKTGSSTCTQVDKKTGSSTCTQVDKKTGSSTCTQVDRKTGSSTCTQVNGNSDEQIKTVIEELVSKVGESDGQRETPPNPNLQALAQACGDSILNPDYLLTGGEPFTSTTTRTTPVITSTCEKVNVDVNEFLSSKSNGTQFVGMTVDSMLKAESPADMMLFRKPPDSAPPSEDHLSETPEPSNANENSEVDAITSGQSDTTTEANVDDKEQLNDSFTIKTPEPVELLLHSEKMKGLRKLLSSQKLNTSAITLQLTAQSQTQFKGSKRGSEVDYSMPRKRTRREMF